MKSQQKKKRTVTLNLNISSHIHSEPKCNHIRRYTNPAMLHRFLEDCKRYGISLPVETELSLCKAFLFATPDQSLRSHYQKSSNRTDSQFAGTTQDFFDRL